MINIADIFFYPLLKEKTTYSPMGLGIAVVLLIIIFIIHMVERKKKSQKDSNEKSE